MLFKTPCCTKLEEALSNGETRMFDLVGEPKSVLMLATSYSRHEHEGQIARVWVHEPVLFCLFCGTQLQTQEAIEKWKRGNAV
jgi:hypothetical protein